MFRSKFSKYPKVLAKSGACVVAFAMSCTLTHAGGGGLGPVGQATEWTQLLNNGELIKQGVDSAQTSAYTVSQYMTQLDQYRAQLRNTIGIDPVYLNSSLAQIDNTYRQSQSYLYRINAARGSLSQQNDAYQQRFDAARLQNLSRQDYINMETQRIEQGNQAAIARRQRNLEVIEQSNRDIAELQNEQRNIPNDLSQNESIQKMHATMGRVAVQNATIVSLLADRNEIENDKAFKENQINDANRKTFFERQLQMRRAMDARQSQMVNELK